MTKAMVAGWCVGLLAFIGLSLLVPAADCNDGWHSYSIGRQGACSHHGGVNEHGFLKLLALVASIGAGIGTHRLISKEATPTINSFTIQESIHSTAYPNQDYISLIRVAIKERRRVQFLYKTPEQSTPLTRTVKPIALIHMPGRYANENVCLKGFCDLRRGNRTFLLKRMEYLKIL